MFKKVLQSLSKSLSTSKPTAAPPPRAREDGSLLDRVAKGKAEAAPGKAAAPKPILQREASTPEELCEIQPGMSKGQIHEQLKLLYRRYNRSASSLDTRTRAEAERMLDAIVQVREKHLGSI